MGTINPQSILNGGRDYNIRDSLNVNNGDLSQQSPEPQEQIFSQIPEDISSGNSIETFEWGGAAWFPDNLGSPSNAYYVKFEVFILDGGYFNSKETGSGDFALGNVEFDKSNAQPRSVQNVKGSQLKNVQTDGLPIVPVMKKLNEIIALPMPDGITSDHSTMWSKAEGGLVSAIIATGDDFISGGNVSDALVKSVNIGALSFAPKGLANLESKFKSATGMDLTGTDTNLKLLTKRAPNPRNEFLFDGVNNRSFNLQWKFIPKSASEANKLRGILEKMKLYMYPELDRSTAGNYFLFPAMFDITFMHGAQENEWLYRTSTCAMTNMIINYTGAGQWIATDNNGAPFAWEVTMQFTESEFLHRDRFKNSNNPNGVAR